MNDLDKLLNKLETNDPKVEVAKVEEPMPVAPMPVAPMPEPTPAIDDDEDEEDEVAPDDLGGINREPVDPTPANVDPDNSIEAEVGILQNDGIFRRELLLVKKEQVDVLKIIAQTLLDIKKKLVGEDDGKKN